MRPIDADKFIDYIGAGHLRGQFTVCFSERNLVDMINKQPTIEQPKWIPVTERLPEFYMNEDGCLCTHGKIVFRSDWDKTVHIGYCIKLIYIINTDTLETIETIEWYDDSGHKWENITDWMPLPKGDE